MGAWLLDRLISVMEFLAKIVDVPHWLWFSFVALIMVISIVKIIRRGGFR